MKNSVVKNLIFGVAALSAVAVAQTGHAQGFYVGVNASQAFVDEPGLDDDDTGGRIYGGYKFNDYISVEASYYDFGEFEDQGNALEIDGGSLAIIGSYPLTGKFSIFAKAGAHDWDADVIGISNTQLFEDSDTDAFYGIGVEYKLTDQLSLRSEAERYEVEDIDIDVATFGISFKF